MSAKLTHLSESRLETLRSEVSSNLSRYLGGDFTDLTRELGWAIELEIDLDVSGLDQLDGSDNRAATDLKNTKLVSRVLDRLPPSLANEERLWVRLSHVEAFAYTRDRWLSGVAETTSQISAIEKHFFAKSQTGIRDDHALSRLWWNGYIAKRNYPQAPERAMELLLTSADVRSNLIERFWLTARRPLAAGVFRQMEADSRVMASEISFREFMKAINVLGGGVVFEAMTEGQIDDFLKRCADRAANIPQA